MDPSKHIIVISVDALVYEDLAYVETLPMFGKVLRSGSRINRVKTIYPALTHPIHAAMMTGCAAGKTGITANETFHPGVLKNPWFNHLNEVQCETIFHAAHKAGYTTAACRWPVTANGGDAIDYLIPEVMGLDMQGHTDDPAAVYRALGATPALMDIVEDALRIYGPTNAHPAYDEMEMYCAARLFARYRPNLLLIHPGYVDGERHRTGLFSPAVENAVKVTDEWIRMVWNGVRQAGLEEQTDLVIVSDHGHLNIVRTVCPNVFLRDAGLLQTDAQGNLTHWDAYCQSCGLSAHVYLRDKNDPALYAAVRQLLENMAEEKLYGFSQVLTVQETAAHYGLDGDFSFVLETDGYTSFQEDWNRPTVRGLNTEDYRFGHATHGHMPEKGPQPPFLCMGPSFRPGIVIEEGNILNHAPTIAAALGISLPEADGKPVKELLSR